MICHICQGHRHLVEHWIGGLIWGYDLCLLGGWAYMLHGHWLEDGLPQPPLPGSDSVLMADGNAHG